MDGADVLDNAERTFFADLQRLLLAFPELPFESRRHISKICSVDAAYTDGKVVAVATEFTDGVFTSEGVYRGRCTFPYVSSLFYLREGPPAVEAVRCLKTPPHLVCFDAHGSAPHPRGMGMATLCGMILGVPSIGITKSRMLGRATDDNAKSCARGGEVVDFVSGSGRSLRYWSAGYSVKMRDLRSLITRYGPTCLEAMAISDRRAREEARHL